MTPMPPFSIPSEVFCHLRRDLRVQSGIPFHDPTDPSVPDLVPYESCFAGVDPSPPYLRCKNCNGRLLRGGNSALCVFCGEEGFGDAMPDPLKFRDTMGYAWLLEALGLDGSESLVPIFVDEPYRGKKKVKGEIRLSDLLNLEIKWSAQEEKLATGGKAESAQPKSDLNLGGVDLDNFVGEGGTTGISLAEAEKKRGDDEGYWVFQSNIAQAPDNLSLFGNVPPSSMAGKSTDYESGNSMSAWDAESQLADSETSRELDQIQALMSQTNDLSFMLDSNVSSPPHSGMPRALEK